jgi:hypothetical protein
LASTDEGKVLEVTGTVTLTIPNSLATGFQCAIVRIDASNATTIAAEGTLRSIGTVLGEQYAGCAVYKSGASTSYAFGYLEAP